MSKITKAICDNCNKEIKSNEMYYSARITQQSEASDIGRMVADGDFCKKCFKEKLKEEMNLKDE